MEQKTALNEESQPNNENQASLEQKQELENKVIKLTLDSEVKVVSASLGSGEAIKTNNLSLISLEQQSTERTSTNNSFSDDEEKKSSSTEKHLPTFTNEVIVIRPEYFYENTDCQKDNKFMKNSNMQRESTN